MLLSSYTGCNVIPLPPKDPKAVQQMAVSKPRHQRKYPLVMPNSSGSLTCQMAAVSMINHDQQMFCNQMAGFSKYTEDRFHTRFQFFFFCSISDSEHKSDILEKNNFVDHHM